MKRLAALLAGTALMVVASSAWATPTLQLFDGTTTKTIADGSAEDSSAAAGVVTFNGVIGNWDINVSTGLTKPAEGTVLLPYMDLNSLNHTNSTGGGSLQILFSETDFLGHSGIGGFDTKVGGTTAGTFSLKSYYDTSNSIFGTTNLLADLGPFGPGAFSGSEANDAFVGTGLYSLTLEADITHTGKGSTSFDAEMTPVPEPGTMMLLGAGFLGLAIYGKRRKNA